MDIKRARQTQHKGWYWSALRMTPQGARDGHETSIKPVMELNFPRVEARDYHWFIQQVCQQGGEEGKQWKPDLKRQGEAAWKPKKKPDTQQAKICRNTL